MEGNEATRRDLLRSLAILPVTALLLQPGIAAGQAPSRIVVFNGVQVNYLPGVDVHVFGWAAETSQGWIGRVLDGAVAIAMRDFPGFAAGTMMVVPKGMANTINGHMDKDGVRGSSICWADVIGGSVMGSTVKLTGKLTHSDNPMIYKVGDPTNLEGNKDTGEFTYTLHGAGRDVVLRPKGQILTS